MPLVNKDYYLNDNVVWLAKDLIGKILVTRNKGRVTSGIITETEAYNGVIDKACHAYGDRRTARTETMYLPGGHAYVYLCYGIHHLFNIVVSGKDIPKAVLIRGIQPVGGLEIILERRNAEKLSKNLCIGPGKVSQALGITTEHSGISLVENKIWLEDDNIKIDPRKILSGPRIGVDYAGEDAKLPYRFWIDKI